MITPRIFWVVAVSVAAVAVVFVTIHAKNSSKVGIDPEIATVWTAAVATGLDEATLSLKTDGSFTLETLAKGKAEATIRGTYTVDPPPPNMPGGKMARARVVKFFYDLPSLKASGTSASDLTALEKSGKKSSLGMQLWYFAEVPVLTDVMTAHFVPENDKEGAIQRLTHWKPF